MKGELIVIDFTCPFKTTEGLNNLNLGLMTWKQAFSKYNLRDTFGLQCSEKKNDENLNLEPIMYQY